MIVSFPASRLNVLVLFFRLRSYRKQPFCRIFVHSLLDAIFIAVLSAFKCIRSAGTILSDLPKPLLYDCCSMYGILARWWSYSPPVCTVASSLFFISPFVDLSLPHAAALNVDFHPDPRAATSFSSSSSEPRCRLLISSSPSSRRSARSLFRIQRRSRSARSCSKLLPPNGPSK